MRKAGISLIYFLTGIIYLILQNHSSFYTGLAIKSLIIPELILLFAVNQNPFKSRLNILMLSGLAFSWAGDIVLEFSINNGLFFIAGLICFLLAHVMYFSAFVTTKGKNFISGKNVYLLIPVIVYGLALVIFLYPGLSEMRLPVIIYAVVILSMFTAAMNRKGKVNRQSYSMVLAGAGLFVISDSLIAINKFSFQFEYSGIAIMSTYILAQFLIITGYIRSSQPAGTK